MHKYAMHYLEIKEEKMSIILSVTHWILHVGEPAQNTKNAAWMQAQYETELEMPGVVLYLKAVGRT